MDKSPRKRKIPRKITAKYLQNAGIYYLQRFASSSANFRRVMMRRVERSAKFHNSDVNEGAKMVESLILRFNENGLLDDKNYARALTSTMHRRGASGRAIYAKLRQKGLSEEDIIAAQAALGKEYAEPEFVAAISLARRRRLGPFRKKAGHGGARVKDLASLARAGFAYDIALKVIDAETAQELEDGAKELSL